MSLWLSVLFSPARQIGRVLSWQTPFWQENPSLLLSLVSPLTSAECAKILNSFGHSLAIQIHHNTASIFAINVDVKENFVGHLGLEKRVIQRISSNYTQLFKNKFILECMASYIYICMYVCMYVYVYKESLPPSWQTLPQRKANKLRLAPWASGESLLKWKWTMRLIRTMKTHTDENEQILYMLYTTYVYMTCAPRYQ